MDMDDVAEDVGRGVHVLDVTAQPVGSPGIGTGRLATVTTNGNGYSVPPNWDMPPPPPVATSRLAGHGGSEMSPAAPKSPIEPPLLVRTVTLVAPAGPCGLPAR